MSDGMSYIIATGILAACIYALWSMRPGKPPVPWWKFWNPRSGMLGGLIFAFLLLNVLYVCARMGF